MQKLGICIPWDSHFVLIQSMISIMNLLLPDGVTAKTFRGHGWCPAQRHNKCVMPALVWGADHILILGADEIYEEATILKLARHLPEYDMASGIVPSRGSCGPEKKAFAGMGFKMKDNAKLYGEWPLANTSMEHWDIISEKDESQRIDAIGTGTLLMKSEIFRGLEAPFFREFILDDHTFARSPIMDTSFVLKCTLGGAKLWLDTTIKIVHLDVFPIDWTYQDRFADKSGRNWQPMSEYTHDDKIMIW